MSETTQKTEEKKEEKKVEKKDKKKKEEKPKDDKKEEKKNEEKKKKEEKPKEEPFIYVNETKKGDKKDLSKEIQSFKGYHPIYVESAWYDWWEKEGYFKPENNSNKERFVIVIPPPNVTGVLHLGHALTVSIQDCLIRWKRMSGYNCLYVPGTDHAGIATQVVVEKKLKKLFGKTRHDYGREEFIKEVFKWKEEHGNIICKQLRRTGASLDWSRECFTMDDKLSKAVQEGFIKLHEKGYIYRATRLVNWDCTLNTAISNVEVEHLTIEKETKMSVGGSKKQYQFGVLTEFAYQLEDSDKRIIVATTRPETMLGDTAVAINSKDERYKDYHGKYVIHPFNGRRIPIVCDDILVDPKFGTGAVKVTPAHDFNDFECGKRHNLQFINILNDDGTLNKNGYPFEGKNRLDVREEIINLLKEKKLFVGQKDHCYTINLCQRSKDIIEPLIKPQWYMECKELAKKSVEAVKKGDLKIQPKMHEDKWFEWLENIKEWCISRQLWWGHRIPAYFVHLLNNDKAEKIDTTNENFWVVANTEEEAFEIAMKRFDIKDKKDIKLEQDPDVLDTWFSSGLFPFSTMGWPDKNSIDLKDFYPNSLLETGSDIIFFWVARMVFMGLALTDSLPFSQIFLHAMVRDKYGKKMSKSLGNVIDPLDVIESISLEKLNKKLEEGNLPETEVKRAKKLQSEMFPEGIPECGTDGLRFTLLNYMSSTVRDINFDVDRCHGYRTFCNKLWNTVAFALTHFSEKDEFDISKIEYKNLSFNNKWILSKLYKTIKEAIESLESFNFATYTTTIYDFWLKELCSIYLELIKITMYSTEKKDEQEKFETKIVLYTVIETCLRLLHPAMPFITEELWQRLPSKKECNSIMISKFPKAHKEWENEKIENDFEIIYKIIKKIRLIKNKYNLNNAKKPNIIILINNEKSYFELLKSESNSIKIQSFTGDVEVYEKNENWKKPEDFASDIIDEFCSVFINLKGMIDINAEVERLNKSKLNIETQIQKINTLKESPNYLKVPQNIKDQNEEKLNKFNADLKEINILMEDLNKLKIN